MSVLGSRKSVVIREVWEKNLEYEFSLIQNFAKYYSCISIDTEFPGVVHYAPASFVYLSTPTNGYNLMKANVDVLKIIQLGMTLSDMYGNLPNFGTGPCFVWQFNFREFDVDKNAHNPKSIELLKRQGIDFAKNKRDGVSAPHFSRLFCQCFRPSRYPMLNMNFIWVSFHGAYDFGYLLKLLTQSELPNDVVTFMDLLFVYFGANIYDSKVILKSFGLHGGLEKMTQCLGVERIAGKHHQAGSDSLLTLDMFIKTKEKYFYGEKITELPQFTYMLYGLNLEVMKRLFS